MAVSGAVSNLPSAPTKTVLGSAVSVGVWLTANAVSMNMAVRIIAENFMGCLRNLSYTPALIERVEESKLRVWWIAMGVARDRETRHAASLQLPGSRSLRVSATELGVDGPGELPELSLFR